MSGAEFPSEVRAFIERHITSGAQLEVLLLVHGGPDCQWTAEAVGRELRIDAEQARKALARLRTDGLLTLGEGGYRFAPRRARKAEVVTRLAALYPTYRVAIISLIFSKPSGPIRDFSEAFRLKEEED